MLACNEEGKIAHALQSIQASGLADELLIFDSGSTDQTIEIARRHTDRVEHRPWVDFTTNRKLLVQAAAHDWVLVLDADEELSPELAKEIDALPDQAFVDHPIFTMPRRNYMLGRHVKAWDPDRIARLFDRRRIAWPERSVHDRPSPLSGTVAALNGAIEHNRHANDFTDYFDGPRYASRIDALAREMYDQGRRVGWAGLMFRPLGAFAKFYLFKGGFLQGSFGLILAQKAAVATQLKYTRLWDLQRRGG